MVTDVPSVLQRKTVRSLERSELLPVGPGRLGTRSGDLPRSPARTVGLQCQKKSPSADRPLYLRSLQRALAESPSSCLRRSMPSLCRTICRSSREEATNQVIVTDARNGGRERQRFVVNRVTRQRHTDAELLQRFKDLSGYSGMAFGH